MREQLNATFVSLPQCGICCNWDVSTEGNRVTKKNKLPQNYPKTRLDNMTHPNGRDCSENVILPHIQTYEWLLCSAKFAHEKRKAGKWNKIECSQYLLTMDIVTKVLEKIESNLQLKNTMSAEDTEEI